MTIFTVPLQIVHPSGTTVYMPGSPSYVDGDDVSDAFNYWLWSNNGGVGTDGYTGMSSSNPSTPNTLLFQPETYWLEYGSNWGSHNQVAAKTDRRGLAWPKTPPFAIRNLIVDGQNAVLRQDDPTPFDDGIKPVTITVTAGAQTATLSAPLTAGLQARFNSGGATIQANFTTAKVFFGNTRGDTVNTVVGTTITFAHPALQTVTSNAATMFFAPVEGRRNSRLWMLYFSSPGLWKGVERACLNQNLTFRNLRIRMSNLLYQPSVFTAREAWHGLTIRSTQNLTFEPTVTLSELWGDCLNFAPNSQAGDTDVGLQAESITFQGRMNGCGRHFMTGQGNIDVDIDGAIVKNIGRLMFDNEITSTTARCFRTTFRNSVFGPGTEMWHIAPAPLNGEPPMSMTVTTVAGSKEITVPYDWVTQEDIGGIFTGTGIPAGAYALKRLSATKIELTEACIASGTVTALMGSPVSSRDHTFDNCSTIAGCANIAGNAGCPGSRVYFTGVTTEGSNVITDVQFETRADGLVFTTADLGTGVVSAIQPGLIVKGAPSSVTSTTVTMPSAALKTTPADATFDLTSTLNSRILTSALRPGVFADGNPVYKGKAITGPNLPAGRTLATVAPTQVTIDLPATASGTGTYTVAGRSRFWAPIGPAEWTNFTVNRLRNIGIEKWGGASTLWQQTGAPTLTGQPSICIPRRWDGVSITRSFLTGARKNPGNVVARYMMGAFDGNLWSYGDPGTLDSWTTSQNRGVDMVDNQAATPTVTSTVTIAKDNANPPTFTIHVTFSDARTELGSAVNLNRNGHLSIGVPLDASNNATFTWWDPLTTGIHAFTANWAGSWNSLTSPLSNEVVINVGNVTQTPTTTTLAASPASPQPAATPVTLTATVSPDPGDGSTVTFTDSGSIIGIVETVSGVATLDVVMASGDHPLVAGFDGTGLYAVSSGSLTYTISEPVDSTPPELLSSTPAAGAEGVDRGTNIVLVFSEALVGEPVFNIRTTDEPFTLFPCTMSGSGDTWTCNPSGLLQGATTYLGVLDDAEDAAGNHLAGRVSWSFTTEASSTEYIPVGLLTAR